MTRRSAGGQVTLVVTRLLTQTVMVDVTDLRFGYDEISSRRKSSREPGRGLVAPGDLRDDASSANDRLRV
jgi:hypothetical protein